MAIDPNPPINSGAIAGGSADTGQSVAEAKRAYEQAERAFAASGEPQGDTLAAGPARVARDRAKLALAYAQARAFNQGVASQSSPFRDFYATQSFGASNLNLPGMQLGNQDQSRLQQAQVIQALQAQAAGSKDTLGQQQLQQGFGQAAAQQRSLGSSIRGAGGGAGLRAGAMGAADTQRGLAGQSEMLRLQEQQAAQAMLAQLLAQQHAQDVGLAGSMASGSLANQQLNQDMERFYSQGMLGQTAGDYQRAFDYEQALLGQNLQARDTEDRFRGQVMGAAAGAAGTGFSLLGKQKDKEEEARRKEPSV